MPPQSSYPQPAPSGQYDFITAPPTQPPKSPLAMLGGGSSLPVRIGLFIVFLIVLLIIFNIAKGLLSGPGLTPYVSVAQDQQELLHIVKGVKLQEAQQQALSTTDQNFAATAQLSLTSDQTNLLKYLKTNGLKIDPKILNLKVSATVDKQLTTAVEAATYDQTFKDVSRSKLVTYSSDLQRAFSQAKGKNGKALLQSEYAQAQLLITQLDTPTN